MIRLELWTDSDLDLLRLINTPGMRAHVGGAESPEALLVRHRRYLDFPGQGVGAMFKVVLADTGEAVGSVGCVRRRWQGAEVFEMGWNVLPPFQGRGIAVHAARAGAAWAAGQGAPRRLHAFPSVDNAASNRVCARVGFELQGECDFEYPPGRFMRSHDWRLELTGRQD
ncbi:GNAT family N-acetyltransferase [Kitasatospora sp. NPDC058965]|uniref:GNAT family N-acetyltransferase n=1 Tax=Kitasatospora sp. NPDC058965 TaxID=3346682 RepID=UPI0036B650E1